MYAPAPERIFELYSKLDKGETLELVWKNPGRRPPTPDKVVSTAPVPQAAPQAGNNDFDFEEEGDGVAAVTPQRRAPGTELKGSARKQTASFNSVLSNMKRHKMLEDQDQDMSGAGNNTADANKS